jgi:hypothetical protein
MGGILYGNWLRLCILFSITISQVRALAIPSADHAERG